MRLKVLSLLMAVVMVIGLIGVLASCGGKTNEKETVKETTKETKKETETEVESKKESETEEVKVPITFTEADGDVYVNVTKLNYRSSADIEDASIAGQLDYGTKVERTGISNNGEWTRIVIKEKTYYVKTQYVTEALDVLIDLEEPEELYVTADSLNVRLIPNFEDSQVIVGVLKKGDKVVRVAISEDGSFSRIKFTPEGEDQVEGEYYVGNRYLSKEAPEAETK